MSKIVICLVMVLSYALRGWPVPTSFEAIGVQAFDGR
jgi:hypothetical protein